jgi:urease alpha subunit
VLVTSLAVSANIISVLGVRRADFGLKKGIFCGWGENGNEISLVVITAEYNLYQTSHPLAVI